MSDDIDRANEVAEFNLSIALANRQTTTCGPSLEWCDSCGNEIPEARRQALPGVKLCIDCAREEERREALWR